MSRIARTLRFVLQRAPVRASFHAAGIVLACAAAMPAIAQGVEEDAAGHAQINFTSCAKPQYPHADLQAGHQGTVTLGFLVDETGRVQESKVTRSSGFADLDEAARAALAKCSFHPAQAGGKPVRKWTTVQYVWSLH